MLAAVLSIFALAGGCAATYAIMDAPRRRAVAELRRLHVLRDRLDERAVDLTARHHAAVERKRALDAAVAAHDARAAKLTATAAAFDARVIAYDELAGENRVLKTSLRNVAAQVAYQECGRQEAAGQLAAAAAALTRVGADFFEDVRAAAMKGVTPTTYPAAKHRLQNIAAKLRAAGCALPPADEARALADLHAQYERAVRGAVERDEQARVREQIREEQRRERETREAIDRAERERRVVADALERAVAAAAGQMADATGRHAAEVERLRAQLADAEAKSQRAVSQAQLTRAGSVYVISNVGSYGPDVLKIGMTRRLEPLDRVDELSGASVPFPFDVHFMISSDDAPKLEAELHRTFHTRRVNRVNPRKEFFRVPLAEVAATVQTLPGVITYEIDPERSQYLQSQQMTDAELAEVETAYARAEAAAAAAPGDDE